MERDLSEYGLIFAKRVAISSTSFHDRALTAAWPSGISSGPPGQGTNPPRSVATIAIESVSSITNVLWSLETQWSSNASIRRAPPVINEARGGKQNSPGNSGWATVHVYGSGSMPWLDRKSTRL